MMQIRIGLHDKFISPTWFSDAFIALFGYPCYLLSQCGIDFSTFLFVQATITLIIKMYITISNKYNLKQNFLSLVHSSWFFTILTAQMVNDLTDTLHHKPTLALQTSKSLDYFSNNPTNSNINQTEITSLPLFYTKHPNKLHMTRYKLFPKKRQFLKPKIYHRTSTLPSSSEQHPNYSTAKTTQNGNFVTPTHYLVNNTPVSPDTDSPIKVYSKQNTLFLHNRFKLKSLCLHIFYRTLHC